MISASVRRLLTGVVQAAALVANPLSAVAGTGVCPGLLLHTAARLQGESPQNVCQFAGRVLLVVNTARRCGYTPQYEALGELHARDAPRWNFHKFLIDRSGRVVASFPSADDPFDTRVTTQIESLLDR